METKRIGAVLLAGGQGTRMRDKGGNKVLMSLLGKPVLQYSLEALAQSSVVEHVVVVTRDAALREAIRPLIPKNCVVSWAQGGARRQDSVLAGVRALPAEVQTVLVHDAARPLVSIRALCALRVALGEYDAAALAAPVTDTVVVAQEGDPVVYATLSRSGLWSMQTPQGATRKLLEDALSALGSETVTDEASALHRAGHSVFLVHNPDPNPKLTYPHEVCMLEALLKKCFVA